jgi:hypothetical protein
MDGLIVRIALYCWMDWMRETCHNILDGGVLHLDLMGVQECLFALLEKKRF